MQLSLEILTGLGATLPEPDVQVTENEEEDVIEDDGMPSIRLLS